MSHMMRKTTLSFRVKVDARNIILKPFHNEKDQIRLFETIRAFVAEICAVVSIVNAQFVQFS